MIFKRLFLPEIVTCTPEIIKDQRGYFTEIFREDLLSEFLGYQIKFVQENLSLSKKGVFRGLHYQKAPFAQSKMITVVDGEIVDVVVDIRKNSPNFGQHLKIPLSAEKPQWIFIPKGFAHGFLTVSSTAKILYKVDNYYNAEKDAGINVKDTVLKINLPFENIQYSEKDAYLPLLKDI